MRKHNEVSVYWKESRNGWYYRVQIDGKRVEKATGVGINNKVGRAAAEAKAKRIAEGLRSGNEEALAKAVRRPGYATAGEIVDRFKLHGPGGSAVKAASAVRSFSLLGGLVARRSSTGSTRPMPKKFAQTRFTIARVK